MLTFGDLRSINGFEDHPHHQEAYARNDHVQQLLLLQDLSRARAKSKSVRYQNDIERIRDRTRMYRKDTSVYFPESNIHSTKIEMNAYYV